MSKSSCYNNFREIKKLKECFRSLDDDDSGCIGVSELQEPLIGLGFADNMQDVNTMVRKVDEDGSNMIEFGEFLAIIKMSGGDE